MREREKHGREKWRRKGEMDEKKKKVGKEEGRKEGRDKDREIRTEG